MNNRYYYIPANLDIDRLLAQFPFQHIPTFNKDCLYYILNLIVEIPANNKDLIDEDGYTPINASILRKRIGNEYHKYIKWLIDAGVIETTRHFIVGKKSTTYRFRHKYNNDLVKVLATFQNLSNRLENENTIAIEATKLRAIEPGADILKSTQKKRSLLSPASQSASVYTAVANWYSSGKISINLPLAHRYNETLLQYKLQDASRWDTKLEKNGNTIKKNPIAQYHANFINIDKISQGIFNAHPDENVYRFHSTVTYCKKELRNAITLDGCKVAAVDLSNSQPTLLTILLNPEFVTGANLHIKPDIIPGFNLQDIFTKQSKYSSFITMLKNTQNNENGQRVLVEFDEYKYLVENGLFYPEFRARVENKTNIAVSERNVKSLFFTVLFTDNRFIGQPEAAPKRVFRDWFPNLYELTSLIKSKDAANLPVLLQRLESFIMYHKIVARLTIERPDLPIIPIHDSIATVQGEEQYIEKVMREELANCLGFKPHFKKELWDRSKLEADIAKMQR